MLTTDMIAEGVHFFADDPPASVARKALRVNLSDLAAKGATPFGYLISLALPEDWTESWLAGFAEGLRADQERYDITLIGGDTIRAAGGLTVSVTALGRIPKGRMVTRAGARPGDAIFVSGTIGDAALGLGLRQGRIAAGEGRGRQASARPLPAPAAARGAGADPAPLRLERHGRLRRAGRRSRAHLRCLRRRRRDRGGAGAAVAGGAPLLAGDGACCAPSSPAATTTRSWRP